jgi:hypothetical protein
MIGPIAVVVALIMNVPSSAPGQTMSAPSGDVRDTTIPPLKTPPKAGQCVTVVMNDESGHWIIGGHFGVNKSKDPILEYASLNLYPDARAVFAMFSVDGKVLFMTPAHAGSNIALVVPSLSPGKHQAIMSTVVLDKLGFTSDRHDQYTCIDVQ